MLLIQIRGFEAVVDVLCHINKVKVIINSSNKHAQGHVRKV